MLLTPELAQPIVDRAMAILQRNVNIMDATGTIVGSGDPSRVGNAHQGAVVVLRTGHRVEIQPEDVPNWGGVRMGVNLPLRLDQRIVGVVGITGPPEEVRPFGELIREMVQLMLDQVRLAELERTTALAREALLRDLLTGTSLTDLAVREADLLGLTRSTPFVVLLCEPPPQSQPGDYAWLEPAASLIEKRLREAGIEPLLTTGPWDGRLVVLTGARAATLVTMLQTGLPPGTTVAAGLPVVGIQGLQRSYRTAILALRAGRLLHGAGAFTADGFHLETLLATVLPEDAGLFTQRVLGGLPAATSKSGRQLRETIKAFLRTNLSLSAAADLLGIHRHTLMYRLDQVQVATGFDPRLWEGAVRLHLALILEGLFGHTV